MIEKKLRQIITFNSTTDAIAFEKFCKEKAIEGRLIPVPRNISASCGLCWSAPSEYEESINIGIEEAGLRTAGVYQMFI
ncbi:MAG: DUF3343 domain-containing protein [Anaerovoracaceae bacterium]